jgi:hypothetical protein
MLVTLNTGLIDGMSMDTYTEFSPDEMYIDDYDDDDDIWDTFSMDKYTGLMVDAFKQEYLNERIELMNSDYSIEIVSVADKIDSPREYNFATDTLDFNIEIDIDKCIEIAKDDMTDFNSFLKDNYTSYDGFWSYTANSYAEWVEKFRKGRIQEVAAFLNYFGDVEYMQQRFADTVHCISFCECIA